MAKLPDATAFGAIDAGTSGRPIATYDVSGYARGAAAEAAGFEKLGEGISTAGKGLAIYAKREEDKDDALDLARAKSEFLTKKVETDELYKDDKDHGSLVDRYGKDIDKVRAGASSLIRNPRNREMFELQVSDDVAKAKAAAGDRATTIWKDNTLADGNTRLEEIRNAALKSSDPEERAKLINAGNDLISSLADKNIITRTKAAEASKEWTVKYAAGALSLLPAEQRLDELRGPAVGRDGVLDRIGKIENSSGNPALRSSTSSAMGDFQFINSTWLQTVKANRPDLLQGRTEAQVLALRADPKLSREMAGHLLDANGASLQKAGLDATPSNLYLAHFLGPAAAAAVLKAKPGTPVSDILDPKAIEANSSVLAGKTVDSVINWSARKMGTGGSLSSLLPEDTRARMQHQAQQEVDTGIAKAASAQSEIWERKTLDAAAGIGPLPNRKDIENDPVLDEPRRNVLLRQHDAAAGDVAGLNNFMAKFKDPSAGAFNPYDANEKKYADVAYRSLGGDIPALQAVVSRTGIMPKSAAASIKGDLISTNPERVGNALNLSANLLNTNPNIFVGVEGKADIENTAVKFRHYVDDLGMTKQEAAKAIIRDQSPEYQAKVKARIKTEDVDAKIKKELSIGDLAGSFDQSWIPFNDPKVGFSVGARQQMFGQYAELVKDAYLDSADGDMAKAKKIAADQLKKTWGVTSVNGSSVVMQYPPERAPAYAGIPNPADVIAKQAAEAIKAEAGADADRSGIRLTPISGRTAQAYKAGQPVPYEISWTDKNGVIQTLNPGRAFVADPVAMRGDVVAERKAVVDAGQKSADEDGNAKLIATPDRFLSQKRRAEKKTLIEARDASIAEGEAMINEGANRKLGEIVSTVGNVLTTRPAGRLGPAR